MRQSRCKPIRHLLGAPDSAEIQSHFAYVRSYTSKNATWCCRLKVKSPEHGEALDKARFLRCAYRRQKKAETTHRKEMARVTHFLRLRLADAAKRKADRTSLAYSRRAMRGMGWARVTATAPQA